MADQNARQDQNRFPALIAHTGTADTAETVRLVADAAGALTTTASLALNSGTITTIAAGTLNTLGTVGVVNSVAEVVKGTTTLVTRTGNVGTLELGSVVVTSWPSSGTLLNLATGTLAAVTTVTTLSNLTNGTVRVSVGTLTTGTLQNLVTGTINALAAGTITGGTLQNLATGTITSVAEVVKGTTTLVSTVTTVSNLTTGSIVVTSGTLGSVANVAAIHNAGTIQAGTVQVNSKPVQIGTSYFQLGTAGASFWGTIIAASGAGTYQYVSGVQIIGVSGTVETAITNIGVGGSAGAGVLARGWIGPGAGIAQNFDPVIRSGTNGTLAYWLGGAGTVDITIQYWQGT